MVFRHAGTAGEGCSDHRRLIKATEKISSLREPHIYCMAKGKEHKKYELGNQSLRGDDQDPRRIVAAVAHEKNLYDAHTLPEVLDQAEAITETRAARAIVDRGYRGRKFVDGTEILMEKWLASSWESF
jgi:transposase, IS5 family